jgi:hypothetical protein
MRDLRQPAAAGYMPANLKIFSQKALSRRLCNAPGLD